jgi:hypothetical protein
VRHVGGWTDEGPYAFTLTPLDRDLRRRCVCTTRGYCYRLFKHFETKPAVYTKLDGMDLSDARVLRTVAAARVWGHRARFRSTLRLATAYLLPKSKCFADKIQWACTKEHEHDRCIVSAPRDGVAQCLRQAARALCVVVRAAGL